MSWYVSGVLKFYYVRKTSVFNEGFKWLFLALNPSNYVKTANPACSTGLLSDDKSRPHIWIRKFKFGENIMTSTVHNKAQYCNYVMQGNSLPSMHPSN